MTFVLLCLASLSVITSRSVCVAANSIVLFFYGLVPFLRTYVPHLAYAFICQRMLGCFHVLAIINSAAVSVGVHASF